MSARDHTLPLSAGTGAHPAPTAAHRSTTAGVPAPRATAHIAPQPARTRPPSRPSGDPLATLPAIGLEELAERAALMTRVDRKYLVPRPVIEELLGRIDDRLRVLEINGRRGFGYRSTYYDTAELASYRAAATGRRRRWKTRRRDYLDTGTSFLEVKTRTGRGESSKLRIALDSPADAERGARARPLDGAPREFVLDTLAAADCPLPSGELLPVLSTRYQRTTVLLEQEEARLTLDDALVWVDPDGRHSRLEDQVVVETKAGTRPGSVDRMLWTAGYRPQRLSKYATGLALMHRELPANRWHRTLGRLSAPTHRPATA